MRLIAVYENISDRFLAMKKKTRKTYGEKGFNKKTEKNNANTIPFVN